LISAGDQPTVSEGYTSSLNLDLTRVDDPTRPEAPAGIAVGIIGITGSFHHIELITLREVPFFFYVISSLPFDTKEFEIMTCRLEN
jgi:hypothetical protein